MHIYWLYLLNFAFLGKGAKITQNKPQIFSTKDSLVLKGFFAIFVALHHLGRQSARSEPPWSRPYQRVRENLTA